MDLRDNFVIKLRDTFFQIHFIQSRFRNVREIMRQRTYALRHSIMPQQTFLINNSLLKAKNNESNKYLATKISQLSEAKKDLIAECFINLAKYDFREKFLVWFRDEKLDQSNEEGQERAEEVTEGIVQTKQMVESLTNFITNNDPEALQRMQMQANKAATKKKYQKKQTIMMLAETTIKKNEAVSHLSAKD